MNAEAKLFHEWLADHARGTLDDEATAALADVVEAVGVLARPGKVTIELDIAPAGSGGRTVVVAGRVKSKPPAAAPEASIFYVGEHGTLWRDDPYAMRIPGVIVEEDDGRLRRVDQDTGEVHDVQTGDQL